MSNYNDTPTLFRCVRCEEFKPATEYHVDNRRIDKIQTWCKACKKDYRAFFNAREKANRASK